MHKEKNYVLRRISLTFFSYIELYKNMVMHHVINQNQYLFNAN
jgi:hypothetical protein